MVMTPDRIDVSISADHIAGAQQGHWTYDLYRTLPDDGQRYEIVNGVLYMSPAPNVPHQEVVLEIASYLRSYITHKGLGRVYIAPLDVKLTPDTIVQPDVLVVLKEHIHRVQFSQIVGAPDLIVEVASPGTVTFDRREKYDAYAQAGVQEYWMVDPIAHTIEVRILEGNVYHALALCKDNEPMRSKVVPELVEVSVNQFFL